MGWLSPTLCRAWRSSCRPTPSRANLLGPSRLSVSWALTCLNSAFKASSVARASYCQGYCVADALPRGPHVPRWPDEVLQREQRPHPLDATKDATLNETSSAQTYIGLSARSHLSS